MQKVAELAANCWEVDRQSNSQALKPYCLVILRNKKGKKSIVKASSTDFESMSAYAETLQEDLQELTNEEFTNKYDLSSVA